MLTETQELELIRSVLVEILPEDSQRVGRSNLNDIVRRRGDVRIVPMPGVSKLDWTVSLTILASATTLLSQCLIITRSVLEARSNGTGALVRFEQHNHLSDVTVLGPESEGSRIVLKNEIVLQLSPEILERLEPALADRLIAAIASHVLNEMGEKTEAT